MSGQAANANGESNPNLGFAVTHQKVFLDLDLRSRKLKGKTDITITPSTPDLKTVCLNCRQVTIAQVQSTSQSQPKRKTCAFNYIDPYERVRLPYQGNVHHQQKLRDRLGKQTKNPPQPELDIALPKNQRITEVRDASTLLNGNVLIGAGAVTEETAPRFEPFVLSITFEAAKIRDGLQFAGWHAEDLRYPHAYTWSSEESTIASLFPCLNTMHSKCTWEISIRAPRTLADAFSRPSATHDGSSRQLNSANRDIASIKALSAFTNEDCGLDFAVICSGDTTDEIVDTSDPSRKITSFSCASPVSAKHIGFAVGPFEEINLAAFRDSDEDDKLGKNAIPISGFSLPGRSDELKNSCLPIAKAMDYFVVEFGSYPFPCYKLCFVDDMRHDRYDTAALSICSTRLLFPDTVIDPMDSVTRELVHGLARQWAGINLTPKESTDLWTVLGISYFITELFLRKLCGNNEYRFLQKRRADRLCDLDVSRPSIYDCGRLAWVDQSYFELVATKAPLVLFILDRRLAKSGGTTGFSRIVSKIFLQTNVGEIQDGCLSTSHFVRVCERLGHTKLEAFFNQWVHGCGCPKFRVTQRFNKKRLVIEMQISQAQNDDAMQGVQSLNFMRAMKEQEYHLAVTSQPQIFTGPMTIRIHEADGTPYEHIVEIKDQTTRFDIPYNTKYKRLRRNRRHRDRTFLGGNQDNPVDGPDDVLLYCLGDVLQSEEEMQDWRLAEWTREDEERMSTESYEWIRMDADFEWICQMTINMPGYMYVSQLQQDRDVVAQYETVQYLASQKAHALVSTILLRTLMDNRYFHGIRTMAAAGLSNHAREEIGWLGWFHLEKAFQTLYCLDSSNMTRSNDFSDRPSYFVQCAIPRAAAGVRDNKGRAPFPVRKFLFEKLRFNDNTNNEYSDSFYIATLMAGLAEATASAPLIDTDDIDMDDEGDDFLFFQACSNEVERYRRLDEWMPSYQNILSVTALRCKAKLAKVGIIPKEPAELLLSSRESAFESVRVAAFESAVELGFCKNGRILRWILHVMGHDSSPLIRFKLHALFRNLISDIATGEESFIHPANNQSLQIGDLIVEQDSTTDARQATLARKQTFEGAAAGLKADIGTNEAFETGLWDSITSPVATISEILGLLMLCDHLYESEQRMVVKFRLPRYWRIAGVDQVPDTEAATPRLCVKFKKDGRFRQKPILRPTPALKSIQPPVTQPPPAKRTSSGSAPTAGPKPLFQLTHKAAQKPPPKATGNANGASNGSQPAQPKLKLVLKAPQAPASK